MSRSTRLPFYYRCCGARSREGKQITSRRIRRSVRQVLWDLDGEYLDVQDKKRGRAGSKSKDWGWNFFGDGRVRPSEVFTSRFLSPLYYSSIDPSGMSSSAYCSVDGWCKVPKRYWVVSNFDKKQMRK